MKAAARELAQWNILVNAVASGLIETDMAAGIPAEAREVVRFLAGDGAAYVTGQTIHVNGGLYM
jgi:3-oxoacyl-[acyl-carrier protein] reductase